MIELNDDLKENVKQFCLGGALGVKALGPVLAYGTKYDFVDFWVQTDEQGKVTAFISKFYGSVCLYAADNADLTELREFISVIGCTEFVANVPIFDSKRFENIGCIMALDKGADFSGRKTEDNYEVRFLDADMIFSWEPQGDFLMEFYRLLCKNNPGYLTNDVESWITDFSHKIRHGFTCPAMLEVNGVYAATAAALNITDEAVFLGAVSTDEEYRGKHYAHTLLSCLCEMFKERTVYLICKKDKRVFYEKAGFKMTGEFYAE